MLVVVKTAWSRMWMGGGLSMVSLSNSSLKCLIQVTINIAFPLFVVTPGVGLGCGVEGLGFQDKG